MRIGDIVLIEWADACTLLRLLEEEEAAEMELSIMTSVGKLIAKHRDRIIITPVFFGGVIFGESVASTHIIPRGAIKKVKVLEAKK